MNNIFQTSSLNVAAWLLTKDIEPVNCISIKNQQALFFYERSEKLTNALDEYEVNKEIKLFISKFKQVKEMIKLK
jgi:hypothetical protein